MIYRLIQVVDGQLTATDFTDRNVIPGFDIRGFTHTGANHNSRNRAELQGAPKFSGVCGPMYGGPGIIRYETTKAYAILSE